MFSLWLLLIIYLIAVLMYKLEQRKFKGIKNIPGPFDLPLFGSALSFGLDIKSTFQNTLRLNDIYGPIVKVWTVYWKANIFLNDADHIGVILSSVRHIEKSRSYKYLEDWIGNGLLTSTGEKWHSRRKLITPAFHFKYLQAYIKIFNEEIDIFIKELYSIDESKIVNIHSIFSHFTLDTISKSITGYKINPQCKSSFLSLANEILHLSHYRLFSLWKNSFALYPYSSDYKKVQVSARKLQDFTDDLINKRINGQGNNMLIDFLLKARQDGKILTDDGVKEEIDTFMFEGQDTLASVLAFTFYEISKNPHVQNKIFEEIDPKIDRIDWKSMNSSVLAEFEYIGAVLKEGLRLYPPVPILMRKLNENAQIGQYTIDKDVEVLINIFSLHRQEKYFPNPNEFNPERFLTNANWHPFCYIPFSGGPRNCIGQKFAVNLLKMVIIKFFKHFQLSSANSDLQLCSVGILRSLNGVNVKIEKRK